jgi:putative ABC transport system substrate-binding protein
MQRRDFITGIAGSAAAWPLVARAQQPAMPVIGYLSPGSQESDAGRVTAVRLGLNETGYVEGQNVAVEYRWAEGQYDRLPELAADLASRQVAVIVTVGTPPTIAAKAATSSIPIIFNLGIDPVAAGLVASLNRPGSNVTGVVILSVELIAKRFELIHELVPSTSTFAALINPANAVREPEVQYAQGAARSLGLDFHVLRATTASEIDAAFGKLVELRAGALVVSVDVDPFFTNQRSQIIALAARHRVPAIYGWREFPVSGGLISYGTSLADSYRQAGIYAGKILKGARPADLPVQQVVKN